MTAASPLLDADKANDLHHAIVLPGTLLAAGGVNSLIGTLTSRTLMFADLETLLAAGDDHYASGSMQTYCELVVDENVCGKNSHSTRLKTFRHLRELYALDDSVPMYKIWKQLWMVAPGERPLLAMLLAAAREPLLRITAPVILGTLPGANVTPQELGAAVEDALPCNYRAGALSRIGRNCASAWAQSGHLKGRARKWRVSAAAGPATVSFALLLAYLGAARGLVLFDSLWVQMLDVGSGQLDQFAFSAGSRGWIDYRRIGDVVDIGFSRWMPVLEKHST